MSWRDKGAPLDYGFWVHTPRGREWVRARYGFSGAKRSYGNMCRLIRTAQEQRLWDREFGRGKRSPARLPNCRDEVWRHVERSWKRHRLTQYRAG